jgi:hypothetical protein
MSNPLANRLANGPTETGCQTGKRRHGETASQETPVRRFPPSTRRDWYIPHQPEAQARRAAGLPR